MCTWVLISIPSWKQSFWDELFGIFFRDNSQVCAILKFQQNQHRTRCACQHMHLDHKKPFHDAVWALEHKCSWKVPQLDGLGVSIVLGDSLAMSMKQLLEGLKNWESYLNSLHPLLKLHLKQFFRNKVSKSLDTDTQSLRRFLLLYSCYSISYLINVSYPVFLSSPNRDVSLYLFNDQIAELLQEHHHALWSAVVLGMAPDETECVEKSRQ